MKISLPYFENNFKFIWNNQEYEYQYFPDTVAGYDLYLNFKFSDKIKIQIHDSYFWGSKSKGIRILQFWEQEPEPKKNENRNWLEKLFNIHEFEPVSAYEKTEYISVDDTEFLIQNLKLKSAIEEALTAIRQYTKQNNKKQKLEKINNILTNLEKDLEN